MLMSISLDWGAKEKFKKLAPDVYSTLRERLPRLNLPEYQSEVGNDFYHDILVDASEAELLTDAGFDLSVKRVKGLAYSGDWFGAGRRVNGPLPQDAKTVVYQVSVANVGLLAVDEVTYEEDCCTDALQSRLDEGWRILAVCPPNDARRPTYILGRTRPTGAQ